ncbi:hypothetical protein [Alkalicoccus urumqiensis]|uniref:Uncharacterized protein n=1 Tax=Alkalicoccus urumqiensis TaxID=1548213 RepID=A0A2P6MGH5_ALKUR|nr:hypothetical protein [Alkalicoccus urumqiensis]PRO65371.1 hypothetical protein C6I21_09415 [Alkalicoccus urumqiensis]
MFTGLKSRFEEKRAFLSRQTQDRIEQFASFERQQSLIEMERSQSQQSILNQEIGKYLKTVHPTFLLKQDVHRALLNMLYSRSEGTFNMNLSMTKEMRKAYSFYHNELKIFIALLERRGFRMEGREELFMQTFLTKLRENNYRYLSDVYGDFVPENASIAGAFEAYIDAVDRKDKYESGHLDFFATYLNQKGIADFTWTKNKMKRKLKQYEKAHKQEFKLKQLERRLQKTS